MMIRSLYDLVMNPDRNPGLFSSHLTPDIRKCLRRFDDGFV